MYRAYQEGDLKIACKRHHRSVVRIENIQELNRLTSFLQIILKLQIFIKLSTLHLN
jgi:hypothetical protein